MQLIRIDEKVIKLVFQFRAPMEMHLVHYKSSYGPDFNTALANHNDTWDTLAVLGVMFRLQSEDNPNLNNIITGDLIILIRTIKKLHYRGMADLHIFKPSSTYNDQLLFT
jgi:hypothetical protein